MSRLPGLRPVGWFRRLVQQVQDPLGSGHRGLQITQQVGRLPNGAGEFPGVQHKGGQSPEGEAAAQIQHGAEDADGCQGEVVDEVDGGAQCGAGAVRLVIRLGCLVVSGFKLALVRCLHAVGADGPLTADALFRKTVQSAQFPGPPAEQRMHPFHLHGSQQDGEGDGDEEHDGQRGGQPQQHDKGARHCQNAGADLQKICGEGGVHRVHIIADAADQVSGGVGVEILDRQLGHPLEGGLPQIVGHRLADLDQPG